MTESSRFFKIIIPSAIRQKKLKIPQKFVDKYRNGLAAVATLAVPTGHKSRAGLENAGKTCWFCDGWQQFMEHHTIGCFYFLLFTYKGNSSFDVHIFDLSATEIRYRSSIHPSLEEHNNGNQCRLFYEAEIKDDDSVEILDSPGFVGSSAKRSVGLDKKGKSVALSESLKFTPRDIRGSCKMYKVDQEQIIKLENVDVEELYPAKNGSCSQVTIKNSGQKSHKFDENKYLPTRNRTSVLNGENSLVKQEWCREMLGTNTYSTRTRLINQASKRAINAARMFKPENPFHMVILGPYHLKHFLQMAKEFSVKMKYLVGGDSDRNTIKLQVSDGREWYVHCIHRRGGRSAMLSKGWPAFVKDNHLVKGDVCVFELIKVKKVMLKVSIFRNAG